VSCRAGTGFDFKRQPTPNALLFNLKTSLGDMNQQLKPALAASLFKDRVLSLGAAAQISGLSLSEFITHLTALDIDLVVADSETQNEMAVLQSTLQQVFC